MVESQENAPPHANQPLKALYIVTCTGLGSVVLYSFQSKSSADFFSVTFAGLLLSGASLLIGGALGFLFGIPRTLQNDVSESEASQTNAVQYRANTNLEQISDWLTKMLVGVGLTQLNTIPDHLRSIGKSIAPALGTAPSAPIMAVSILIFFTTTGFLFGFLWTRLNLATAFRQADIDRLANRVEATNKKMDEFQRQSELDATALNLVYRQLAPDTDAEMIPQEELNDSISNASDQVRAQIYSQAWRVRYENWKNNKALMERTIPVFRGLLHNEVGKKYHQSFGQLGYALKDQTSPDWKEAEINLTKAINLRDQDHAKGKGFYEFNRALCRINNDDNFLNETATKEDSKKLILSDLRAAVSRGREKYILEDEIQQKWMQLNNVSMSDLKTDID